MEECKYHYILRIVSLKYFSFVSKNIKEMKFEKLAKVKIKVGIMRLKNHI